MTLIFTQTAYHTPETPQYRMVINRSEFMTQYHEDKNALLTDLRYAIRMLCAPEGFEPTVTEKTVEAVAKCFEDGVGAIGFEIGSNPETDGILLIVSPDKETKFNQQTEKKNLGLLPEVLYQLGYRVSDKEKLKESFYVEDADAIY